jgi:lysophospholipase L1-like esterase
MDPRRWIAVLWVFGCGAAAGPPSSAEDTGVPPADAALPTIDVRAPQETMAAPHDAGAAVDAPADLLSSPDLATDVPTGFAPCPVGAPCRIMPLGDSLTFGVGSATGAGYRVPLFRSTLAAKQSIVFVGSNSNGPATVDGVPFPGAHEGYRGYAIDPGGGREGLSPLVERALTAHPPHVVLLLAGTNDVGATIIDPPRAPDRLGALVDRIVAAAPAALVVVAQIPPSMDDATNKRIETFNAALPAVIAARAAAGKHVLLIDAYAALASRADYKTSLMFNQFHPNDAGYALIAARWYEAVRPYLR